MVPPVRPSPSKNARKSNTFFLPLAVGMVAAARGLKIYSFFQGIWVVEGAHVVSARLGPLSACEGI